MGFRASCAHESKRLGVAGTVRNRADGSVEVVAEGHEAAVDSLIDWCRVGPTFARVQSIGCINEVPVGEHTFRIIG